MSGDQGWTTNDNELMDITGEKGTDADDYSDTELEAFYNTVYELEFEVKNITGNKNFTLYKSTYCDCVSFDDETLHRLQNYPDIYTELKEFFLKGKCPCLLSQQLETPGTEPHDSYKTSIDLLNLAAFFGREEIVKHLLEIGCDPNIRSNHYERTALGTAIENCGSDDKVSTIASILLEQGANPNLVFKNKQTALFSALLNHRCGLVKLLLEHDASPKPDLPKRSEYCVLCIHCDPCLTLLVNAGADVNLPLLRSSAIDSMIYPLTVAARGNRPSALKILLSAKDVNVNVANSNGDTALHFATYLGDVPMVDMLLEAGADPDVVGCGSDGYIPLMAASYSGHLDIARRLVSHGSNVNAKSNQLYSSIHLAAWEGNTLCVDLLLNAGARYDERTKDLNTPFSLACHGNCTEVIEQLLPLGVNVNNADKDLDTPLLYTTFHGNYHASKLLLDYGADPSLMNERKTTPLWNAVYSGNIRIVHELLLRCVPLDVASRGIDQEAQSDEVVYLYPNSLTPADVALSQGNRRILELLLLAGASFHQSMLELEVQLEILNDPDFSFWFNDILSSPQSLKRISRKNLKKKFESNYTSVVEASELPSTLKSFLLFKII